MAEKNRYSIKHKLMRMSMATSMIAVLLTCIVFVAYGAVISRNSLEKELQLISNMVGARVGASLEWGDNEIAKKTVNDLEVKNSILLACIYDVSGEIFASYFSPGHDKCPEVPSSSSYVAGWEKLVVYNDINFRGEYKGAIYIESDLRDIKKEVPGYILFAVLLMLSVSVIAYIISSRQQKYIAEPILSLVATTHNVIREDNYDVRAKKYDNDEIGDLASAFNKMMSQVRKERQNLERNVQERTSQLEEEKIKAEAASKAKSEFLRNMSHEFRTPLHGMLSFSTYGINEAETAERSDLHRYFSRINLVAQRLLKLVEAILSIAQLESGKEIFNMGVYNLIDAVNSVITEQQALLKEKRLKVIIKEAKFSTEAEFDRDKIVQVITSILGNAIKFTPEGKKIKIAFEEIMYTRDRRRKASEAIRISIEDEGVGIPDDELEKIFDKFVQSSRTNTGAGGTGLGLSIASGIMRGHEGEIFAENSDNGGAIFYITIPREARK